MVVLSIESMLTRGAGGAIRKSWPSILLLVAAAAAKGQVVPDAGSVRQQLDPQRPPALPAPLSPKPGVQPPSLKPRVGAQVTVKQFRFAGNNLLDDAALTTAVLPWVGVPLGFDDLQRATDAIAAAYREAGWIVRAYLPEQDVTDGVIAVQIVEARYAGLRREGGASSRTHADLVEGPFTVHQRQGQPLDAASLDRALLLANDLPGVAVVGTLERGEQDGETALVLQVTDEPRLSGDVGLDNTGARATGSERVTLNLNLNSPWGRGEQIGLNLLHSEGSDFARVRATLPLGNDGLRVGLDGSVLRYHVVDGPAAASAARIHGRSSGIGLVLSYPLVRSRARNVYFSGGLEEKTFFTQDSLVRSDYLTDSLHADLAGNWLDQVGGGGPTAPH